MAETWMEPQNYKMPQKWFVNIVVPKALIVLLASVELVLHGFWLLEFVLSTIFDCAGKVTTQKRNIT